MNPLQSRLAALRARLMVVVTVRGVCLAAAVLLGCLCAAVLFDCCLHWWRDADTWSLLRAAFLVGTLSGTGIVLYWALLRPLSARTDDLSLALRVEEQYPILNDALASTVQFLEQQQQGKSAVSPSMQREAVQRALRLAQGCDFHKAINSRGLTWSVVLLMFTVLMTLGVFIGLGKENPAQAKMALVRLVDPFGDHPWYSTAALTQLQVHYPRYLAYEQPLIITGEVRGKERSADKPKVTVEFESSLINTRTADVAKETGKFSFNIKLENPPPELRFRVRAGDAVSPKEPGNWHVVTLRQPPQLVALGGKASPQITLQRPRYADLPEHVELQAGTGNIDVLAGTVVTLKAATDRPIERVWVEFQPEATGTNEALAFASIGPRHPLDTLITTGLAYGVWGKVPGKIEKTGTEFTVRFLPWLTGAYVLTIQDKDGLAKSYRFDQIVETDPIPVVDFLRPSTSQSVLANADVTLEILARDEKFALRSVWLEYRRKDKHGEWIDAEPKKLFFYDHERVGLALPVLLNSLASAPLLVPPEPMRLRPKMLLITKRWSLKGLAVEGETVVIQACADDFCNVIAFRQPGRSIELELKVVGKAALAGVIGEAESKIQKELLRLRDMQEQAIKKVIAAEQQWRATGSLRPEDVVELAEAEQLQKEIEARIGMKKDEGLRDEIAQLEQMIKDNKLPRSDVTDRLKLLREALEKLSKDNLPKIEPSLAKARRELETPEPPQPPAPKEQGDLGAARAEQEKVYQTLDDLLQYMQEQATLGQIKVELRAILKEQQDRLQAVETLLDHVWKRGKEIKGNLSEAALYKAGKDVLKSNQVKADLRKTAELQRRLAERTQRLLDRLYQLKDKVTDEDNALAEMLAKAIIIARNPPEFQDLAGEMRDTANIQLFDRFDTDPKKRKPGEPVEPNLPRARNNQKNSIATIEAMLEALEQSRADEIEKLTKRQQKQEKHLDELAEKMAKLQEKIELAKKIEDPQARADALKKLADEQRALAQEVEKKARELALMQAPDAAAELDEAAKKMKRAARELDDGKAPDDEIKQAKEQIDNAKDRLKDAQDAAREELTREQIAKIVDLLQGLKERQDAAVAESDRLNKLVQQSKQWKAPWVKTLRDDGDAQLGIAKETASLRDKLKGAKVYHMVLDRATRAMETSADTIKKHKDEALAWQDLNALDDKQLADQSRLVKETVKYQKEASERLEHLIEALLPELEPPPEPKEGEGGGGGGGGQPKQKGGLKAQDGIPPVAQLKVLKAEQLTVNARTKEFAEQHPDLSRLTPQEMAELQAIHAEQERLLDLFREMMTSGNEAGKQQ
jgi:hypothetical protein